MSRVIPLRPGRRHNISELARQHKLSRATIRRKLTSGWNPDGDAPPSVQPVATPPLPLAQDPEPMATPMATPLAMGGQGWTAPVILVAIALALGALGLLINAQVGLSLATSPTAAWTFAGLAAVADLLGLALPSTAMAIWRDRHRVLAMAAWLTWLAVATLATLAALTFSSVNLHDRATARAATISQAAALATQRDSRIATAQAAVATAKQAREAECAIRGNRCRELEAKELTALGTLQDAIASPVPAAATITDAVPEISAAVRLAKWVGLPATAEGFTNLRLALFALLPQVAGLVLAFGFCLLPRRRTQ
jgi:hypothetical protein